MDGDAVVILFTAFSNTQPVPFLLVQIQTSCVGGEKYCQDESQHAKPRNYPELCIVSDVIVDNGQNQGPNFPYAAETP